MAEMFMASEKGFTAIKSQMRDVGNGKVIAMISDGESGRKTLISANALYLVRSLQKHD